MAKSKDDKATEAAAAQVQERLDEAHEKGYIGVSPDPTPRENYTVAGVTSGAPTPETDEKAAADAADPNKTR